VPSGAARRPFLTAEWRDLAVLNFEVDPALLRPFLPPSAQLDLWRGTALVSLVGFRFLDVRVLGAAIPFHRDFDEVNLRFYVRPIGGSPEGRGVVFIREFVPRRGVSLIANTIYGENYATAVMRHDIRSGATHTSATYSWRWRGHENVFAVEARGEPTLPPGDSAEAFIFEHYWGYGRSTYRVDHPQWRTYPVTNSRCQVDGDDVYGAGFGEALARPPVSAMLAEGSAVTVYRRQRADQGAI
jgi:uncharacterized protein YqjF (DUF2071 family)